MVNRGGKRKKKRSRKLTKGQDKSKRNLRDFVKFSPDATMVLLGIMQLGLGLIFMTLLANYFSGGELGQSGLPGVERTEGPDRPFSPFVAYGYTIFTFCLWTLLISRRYRLGLRQLRFLTILYMPGTLMAVWILYRYFAAVGAGE